MWGGETQSRMGWVKRRGGRNHCLRAEPRRCTNLLARRLRAGRVWPEANTFSKSVFEPGDDSRENTRLRAGAAVCMNTHVCVQAGVWVACLLVEVARMHVGACGVLFSPNMACEEVCVDVCV